MAALRAILAESRINAALMSTSTARRPGTAVDYMVEVGRSTRTPRPSGSSSSRTRCGGLYDYVYTEGEAMLWRGSSGPRRRSAARGSAGCSREPLTPAAIRAETAGERRSRLGAGS